MKFKVNIKLRLFGLIALAPMLLFLYLFGQTIKYNFFMAALHGISAFCWLVLFLIYTFKAIKIERKAEKKQLLEA